MFTWNQDFLWILVNSKYTLQKIVDDNLGIDDLDFTFFEQCEILKKPKERETFW